MNRPERTHASFPEPLDRRQFLWRSGGGLGGIALAYLSNRSRLLAAVQDSTTRPGPQHAPRARRVVQLFQSGAASQCDMFDYKPELIRRAGEKFDPGGEVELFQSSPGVCMPSPWKWRRRGASERWVSDLLPHLGGVVDELAVVHSLTAESNVHGPATFQAATGFALPGFPSAGAWISYGLGSLTDELPTFVALPDGRGYAPNGASNWGAGFLPQVHQATMVRAGEPEPIRNLQPASPVAAKTEAATRGVLAEFNRRHRDQRPGDSRLDARIASYELAAKLQLSAPEVFDLRSESPATLELYGLNDPVTEDFGRRCLVARRLLERGARFVQVWSGADNGFPRRNWDSHEDLGRDHGSMGRSFDRPAAALVRDLRSRGMLDDTIVHCTTEFGRMPCSQGALGRDHNPFAFGNWLAGGGIAGGSSHGASDEWSFRVADGATSVHDIHATILSLLGIDHETLTVRHNGIDRRLTDVHGHVLRGILA